MGYRGRFAPSPTGRLHFGSLVAAVASFAQARARNGTWVIRMEDLDPPREVPGAAEAILDDLASFGMRSDEPVTFQSAQGRRYAAVIEDLRAAGHAFPCACARSDLPASGIYPGTCRDGLPPGGEARSIRLRVPESHIAFDDAIQGPRSQDLVRDVGDFVIRRADGLTAYQLAVVVDDADQDISEIVRGCDLVDSTPRQILIQRLLGFRTPAYAHVPLATENGHKLSKQAASRPVDAAAPVTGLLAAWQFLGQENPSPSRSALRSVAAFWDWALAAWRLDRVPAVPAVELEGAADA